MKRSRSIILVLAVLIIAAGCGTIFHAADTPPQKAQKTLVAAQDTRVTVRNDIAALYVAAQKSGNAAAFAQALKAREAFNRADPAFSTAWSDAAIAVDVWLALPNDATAAAKWTAANEALQKALTALIAAKNGGTP